ncbi:glycosyltransferase [Cellulomonas xiejunii]|uniref:Glycosyltransferase n=1 Tax=Cellulomonas xiejunii TaxID=2968083 RepID=A0ABY5KJ65_9CELL|nr:glycosyltransferase [Cellulomonas xiejunii]MCC2312920.1 glycosyltransferase [Cellulomonas xiejunii]MCC2320210.1 glycosyltransferase [Cellulomonas xiejunii]UUI70517.1 glycosyltransferase [Cellulomonas xiejunii]
MSLLSRRAAPTSLVPTWNARLRTLSDALGASPTPHCRGTRDLVRAVEGLVEPRDRGQVWLALAVLSGVLPEDATVVRTARRLELDGPGALWREVESAATAASMAADVRVVVGAHVVDVNHTVSTDLATGIQRVAKETARRWSATHDVLPVAWTDGFLAMRELDAVESARLTPGRDPASPGIVVPWRSTVLVPELAAEHSRSHRLLSLARHSGNRTGVIGFDCVPLTSAETTATGFASVFYGNLAAVRHFDRVAAISDAAATEYEGWRRMLAAVGSSGPDIRAVALPAVAPAPTADDLVAARDRFCVGDLPMVLVVGSHEPRKNHLAVLHAAERLWREGVEFSLTFIGGNAWGSDEFAGRLAALERAGRPVESASRVPDPLLWAAYRLARVTVFPSLNEGFGLPVAESLAAGTPAITSAYGSMREIAADGGALLVDPRDDDDLTDALRRVLASDDLHRELVAACAARPARTWDDYADEVWELLTAPVGDSL